MRRENPAMQSELQYKKEEKMIGLSQAKEEETTDVSVEIFNRTQEPYTIETPTHELAKIMPLAQKAKPTTIKLPLKKIMKGLGHTQVQIVDQERCIRYLLDISYEKQKLGNLLFARLLESKLLGESKERHIEEIADANDVLEKNEIFTIVINLYPQNYENPSDPVISLRKQSGSFLARISRTGSKIGLTKEKAPEKPEKPVKK